MPVTKQDRTSFDRSNSVFFNQTQARGITRKNYMAVVLEQRKAVFGTTHNQTNSRTNVSTPHKVVEVTDSDDEIEVVSRSRSSTTS